MKVHFDAYRMRLGFHYYTQLMSFLTFSIIISIFKNNKISVSKYTKESKKCLLHLISDSENVQITTSALNFSRQVSRRKLFII